MGSNLGTRPDPSLLNRVDGMYGSLDDLFAAGEAVEGLLAHPGWTHVARLIDAEVSEIEAKLDGRLLESRAEYAFSHGRHGGLKAAASAAAAIRSRAALRLEQQQRKHEGDAEPSPVRS